MQVIEVPLHVNARSGIVEAGLFIDKQWHFFARRVASILTFKLQSVLPHAAMSISPTLDTMVGVLEASQARYQRSLVGRKLLTAEIDLGNHCQLHAALFAAPPPHAK